MVLLKSLSLPFMMKGNAIMTINSWGTQHWAVKSKIKNEFKDFLKSWFLDGDEKLPKELHFEWQPVYKDNRKKDAINVAPTIKVNQELMVLDRSFTSEPVTPQAWIDTLINHGQNSEFQKLREFQLT